MSEFGEAIKDMLVKADADGVPKDVVEHFEEEGEVLHAEINKDKDLGITAEKLAGVGVSVESFMTNFLDQVSNESWDVRTARQFDMGMQTILGVAGLDAATVGFEESFEDAGKFMGKEEQKDHAEKGGEGVLRKIWGFLVNAIKKMVAGIQGFFSALERMAGSIDKIGKEMQTLVKGRNFRTGKVKGSWARYLILDGKPVGATEAISKTSALMKSVSAAWTRDTSVSLNASKSGGSPKLSAISGLHWPIKWPGGTVFKLEGGDALDGAKFSASKEAVANTEADALTRVEADGLVKVILASASAVRDMRTSLGKETAQYAAIANQLASAQNFKRGADMSTGRVAAALTSKSSTVNKACATVMLDNVRCAVQHIKASFGGSAE
jgi:hypothetical protein